MLDNISRRTFLKGAAVPVAASLGVGCNSLEEAFREEREMHVSSDLGAAVADIAVEAMKRGKFYSPSTGSRDFYSLRGYEDNWIDLVSYDLIDKLPFGRDTPQSRSERDEKLKSLGTPLHIGGIEFNSDGGYGVFSSGDNLEIEAHNLSEDGVSYGDKFVFSTSGDARNSSRLRDLDPRLWTEDVRRKSYNDVVQLVYLTSRADNIKNLQTAYKISEEQAKKRLAELVPKILRSARGLFVPPATLPYENWIPSEMQGTPINQLKFMENYKR